MKTRGVHCDKKMSENNHLVQGLGCFKIFLRIHYFSTFRNSLLLEVIHNFCFDPELQETFIHRKRVCNLCLSHHFSMSDKVRRNAGG